MFTAIECTTFGPIEDLRVIERESPALRSGELRIAVSACGVNFVDGILVQGKYQIKPPLPFVPGMEIVGRVVERADDVTSATIGDRVFANVGFGGFASEVVVSAAQVQPISPNLTDGQAATFVQSYMTGWFALRHRAGIGPQGSGDGDGRTLLVLGAGSGVGLAAVDIGSALGLRVVAAASTDDKRSLARELGALEVIDNSALDPAGVKDAAKAFAASFPESADRGGVDYLYDPIGGALGETCLRALGDDGQYLVIGFVGGIPSLPANQVLLRNRRITGVDWGAWAGRHPAENRAMLDEIVAAIDAGSLHPVEPTTYPLTSAAQALADLAERKVAGKVALVP
jgi:NADPH:quinone reductase